MSKPLKQLPGEEEEEEEDFEVETEQLQLSADDPLRNYLPSSFGRQDTARDFDDIYSKARRIPLPPPKAPKDKADDSDDDSDDDDSDSDDDEFPVSHSLELKAHSKAVSSISLDPSGSRIATASHDCSLKLYDFSSMSMDHLHAFRTIEPTGGSHHVHAAKFSQLDSGQSILICPAAPQAKIYTRDGHESVEFVKGDMYLRDMHNTKGHVAEITAGMWHPTDINVCATASADSTIRMWDVNHKRHHKEIMVHKSKSKGGRSRMCCLAWAAPQEGAKSMLASVALDGSLVIYPGNGPFSRPAMEVRGAHQAETWTGGIAFSGDGRLLATRGQDQTVKLWDTRKLKTPLATRTAFPTPHHPETALIFSNNNTSLLTGDASGNLHVLSAATLTSSETHAISASPIVSLTHHTRLNQLLLGTAGGSVHILFSPTASTKGAKTVLEAPLRKRHIDDDASLTTDAAAISGDAIMVPSQPKSKRSANDARRPAMPAITPWGKSQPDQEHIRNSIMLSSMRDEDPREALLKYADKAEKDPMFTGAWKKNQPTTIYAEPEEEEEEEEPDKKKKRRW
ncbi:WD40-repeat-containing domain protein [Tricharina praecox]|uniref:WD40-repeat-containing domain protein n=1 Tax=Tricharina praecox TaxID=43433 RepID=UPI00221FF544|nr:WD40-repeat-containing domain protein [Tricharina praecox]KAI5854698.1 WD40-repeat-containing domain protein [Tricharina praecox]